MKYKQWLCEWLDVYIRPYVKPRTYRHYSDIVHGRLIAGLGEYETDALTPLVLQRYVSELSQSGNRRSGEGLAPNTVYGVISVIKSSLSTAQTVGITSEYCADKLKRPRKNEKTVDCFTLGEQRLIERAVLEDKRRKMLGILLCLYTGLRIGELLALEWSDVDLECAELSVTKSCYDGRDGEGRYGRLIGTPKTAGSTRSVPLPVSLLPLLERARSDARSPYVVGEGEGGPTVRSYQRTFEVLLRRLGIAHRGFHALRHTFATRALECGMDVKTLSEILGHRSPTVTLNRYVHSLDTHKKAMMDRLGELL